MDLYVYLNEGRGDGGVTSTVDMTTYGQNDSCQTILRTLFFSWSTTWFCCAEGSSPCSVASHICIVQFYAG